MSQRVDPTSPRAAAGALLTWRPVMQNVTPPEAQAQLELKRAYLMIEHGQWEEAFASCELAAKLAPHSPTPRLLYGHFLASAGRPREALAELRQVTRRWPDLALGHLYFAEACFMAGRKDQGLKALGAARAQGLEPDLAALADSLEQVWTGELAASLNAPA